MGPLGMLGAGLILLANLLVEVLKSRAQKRREAAEQRFGVAVVD